MTESAPAVRIAAEVCSVGEVVLRRRGVVTELVVDGAFVMDTVDVSTETELARVALSGHPGPSRVLVGGLGLGFTAAEVLDDERVEQVTVAEIAEPLVRWAAQGRLPASDLTDPRLRLEVADVRSVLVREESVWDVVLLDVDNGPDFLVRPENSGLYAREGLWCAAAALAPGGVLAIWSSHRAPGLLGALRALDRGPVEELVRWVHRDGRDLEYAIYVLRSRG